MFFKSLSGKLLIITSSNFANFYLFVTTIKSSPWKSHAVGDNNAAFNILSSCSLGIFQSGS